MPDGARFCPSCGRSLVRSGAGRPEERKLATVLFADLAGSTELAMSLDAEHLRALLADVYRELSQAATAFGGTVEKFIGDAVMAVFGVPRAHEDDPERAVRAALTMVSLTAVSPPPRVECVLRVGVYTGVVVAGTTPAATSWSPARWSTWLPACSRRPMPGEVLIGEPTFRALQPLVRTTQPRSLVVKGRSGPVLGYAVAGVAPATAYRRRRAAGAVRGPGGELQLITSLVSRAVEHRRAASDHGDRRGRHRQEPAGRGDRDRAAAPAGAAVGVGRALPALRRGRAVAPLAEVLLRAADVANDTPRADARRRRRGSCARCWARRPTARSQTCCGLPGWGTAHEPPMMTISTSMASAAAATPGGTC